MTDPADEKPVIISDDDARGALGPEDVTEGETLVPMLTWGLILAVVAVAGVAIWLYVL